jgi:ketosteroid isomerase-like protein
MIVTLALALTLSSGQPVDSSMTKRDLTEIEGRLATAWKNGDCDAWGAIVAPEWSVIHINGVVITKPEALRMCRAPEEAIETLTSDDLSVRAFGDAAVVTGRTTATTGGAARQTVILRFTDVFVRRDGRWQVVASHATRLVP